MTIDETVDLLTIAAAYDLRKLGESDSIAWHAAIGDLRFADARAAVVAHYQETRERIMPADVRQRVKEIRHLRILKTGIPAPPPELLDNPPAYREALRVTAAAIADGRDPEPDVRAVVGQARRELEAS